MVSILPLPNIGNSPDFELEYTRSAGGAMENRPLNAQQTLERFWTDAKVQDVAAPRPGRLMMSYQSPTVKSGVVTQNVNLQACASEGSELDSGAFFRSEVFQQDNIEQGGRTFYQVLQTWERVSGDPGRVSSKQRVAAFLAPTDGKYMEAQGKPVALYDYSFELTRLGD